MRTINDFTMSSHNAPTVQNVDNIALFSNSVLRNLQITQCYSELSTVFSERMKQGANWCTFAIWASKQAGQTIRREDLQRELEALLKNEPEIGAGLSVIATLALSQGAKQDFEHLRQTSIGILVETAANRASDAVSRGNKKVFEEIAREFVLFISDCLNDIACDQSHIDNFCGHLKQGPPPDGQEYLQKAFACYYYALFEEDQKKKTELNFLANLQVGWHEQNRLQPEITEALNASAFDVQQVKSQLLKKLFSGTSLWTKLHLFFQRLFGKTDLLDKAIESLTERMQLHLRVILTEHLMTLTFPPDTRIRLSYDLTMNYPDNLKELTNTELLAMLALVDPTPDSLLESGATDWANLQERMHFITELFRCYHQSNELFAPAFTSAQIEAMKNGKLPQGKL
jgi:hypothetical protein